jgi:hypothetical protein
VSGIPGELFPEALPVERAGAPESAIGGASIAGGDSGVQWEKIPARGAVYLLVAQEEGVEKPLLLATVGDLRAALKRRFTELPPETRSKRIAYGQVCTRIYWRRVDSSFAANCGGDDSLARKLVDRGRARGGVSAAAAHQ